MSKSGFMRYRLVGSLALSATLVVAWSAGVVAAEAEAEAGKADSMDQYYEPGRESAVPFNGSKGFDAVVVRPTTFITSLFSAATFVVSLPFTAFDPAIGVHAARENLVDYPFNDTFKRPLGDLDNMGSPPGESYPE